MPNYVKNIIRMKGIGSLPLYKTYDDGTKGFDFNKLIKMPETLEMPEGSHTTDSIGFVLSKLQSIFAKDMRFGFVPYNISVDKNLIEKIDSKTEEEQQELLKDGLAYISNIVNYGYATWYGWCCENWGTKWNALENEIFEDEIRFETAWSMPEPVMQKLAEMYPDAEIEHLWADEDIGNNSGRRVLVNGKWEGGYDLSDSQEAYKRYLELWEERSKCFVTNENGEIKFRGCEDCDGCN